MIRTALTLAAKGLRVFPCRPRSKRPATANGLNDATTERNTIIRWWQEQPDANVAIATGAASGLFVLDIDGVDAEAALRRLEAEHGTLPPTVEVVTPRPGRHVWFQMPPGIDIRNSVGKVAAGCDVRASGGYALVPRDTHPSGCRYEWSVDSANQIASAPLWLLAKITTGNGKGKIITSSSDWRELVAAGVAEGARDDTITRIVGHLLRSRVHPYVTLELMRGWNEARCRPPLPDRDIERIVASVSGLELKRRTGHGGR
jgi:Bifunctional DNA primase/polymerase, N-terminal/Primase C terminal 1 (PriCT-1)